MVVVKAFLSGIAALSVVFNIIAINHIRKLNCKTVYNFLCINLCFSDLLQSLFGYIPELFLDDHLNSSNTLCRLSAFMVMFFALTSINFLTTISFSRLILMKKPFLTCDESDKKLFLKIGVASWSYALFWSALPLIGVSKYTIEATKSRCSINWKCQTLTDKTYMGSLVILCYVLPIVIVFFSSIITCNTMKTNLRYISKTYGRTNLETIRFIRKESAASRSCLFMFLSYLVCWTPYAIAGIMTAASTYNLPFWLLHSAALLAKSSALVNPLIYWRRNNVIHKFVKMGSVKISSCKARDIWCIFKREKSNENAKV